MNGALHVVTEINPDALALAAELDAERSAGTVRGLGAKSDGWPRLEKADDARLLHGIPILPKHSIATDDKLNTTGEWHETENTEIGLI